jgi:hypothetical protein
VRDLEDVAERVADHRAPVAVRGVRRVLQARRAAVEGPAVRRVRVGDVDVEERGEQVPLALGDTSTREPPMSRSAGRPLSTSPVAPNTVRRNATAATRSLTTIRGITVG